MIRELSSMSVVRLRLIPETPGRTLGRTGRDSDDAGRSQRGGQGEGISPGLQRTVERLAAPWSHGAGADDVHVRLREPYWDYLALVY